MAAVPWIQADERVVGENSPLGFDDVANRPLKFVLSVLGFGPADSFTGINSHSGVGSPEGVVSATVGGTYGQTDAAANSSPLWVKRTGVGNTGWAKQVGYTTAVGIVIGDLITPTQAVGVVAIGGSFTISAAGTGNANRVIAIAPTVNLGSTGNGSLTGGIYIGKIAFTASANDSNNNIFIGDSNTLGAAHAGAIYCIGSSNSIGGHFTGTSNVIAIGTACTVDAAINTIQIGSTLTLGFNLSTQSRNIQIGESLAKTSDGSATIQIGSAISIDNSGEVIAIGRTQTISTGSAWSIVLGSDTLISHTKVIGLGRHATSIQANEFVVGGIVGQGSAINQFRFNSDTDAAPQALTFRTTNAVGANVNGANWTFIASRATGSGTAGSFIFQSSTPAGASSTLQAAATKFTISPTLITAAVPVLTAASVAAAAGLNLPHGTAPSAPVNGDIWTTTAGLFVRVNGVTVGPLS